MLPAAHPAASAPAGVGRRGATPGGGRQRSLERAARWQGVLPAIHPPEEGAPKTLDDFSSVVEEVRRIRAELGLPWEGYDVVIEADSWGSFTSLEPAEPAAWEQAGATWWVESWWDVPQGPEGLAEVRRRVDGRAHPALRMPCTRPACARPPASALRPLGLLSLGGGRRAAAGARR